MRTTPGSTGSSWSATAGCTGCISRSTRWGTYTWWARLPLASASADEIDRILGCVLSYSDENFDAALALGFASSIRKEWAWRVKRGESLANLRAFAALADPGHGGPGGTQGPDPEPGT